MLVRLTVLRPSSAQSIVNVRIQDFKPLMLPGMHRAQRALDLALLFAMGPGQPLWVRDGHPQVSEAPLLPGSVFQLTHNVYKPFIFAADTLTDLSM